MRDAPTREAVTPPAPRSRYSTLFGQRYILIRWRTLLPAVLVDRVGFLFRRLLRPRAAERPIERILAIRLDHIGDVLITTPALRLLRTAFPEARLDVMAGPWSADLLRGDPGVDNVITFDARWYGGASGLRAFGERLRELERERYDVVIDFRGDLRHLAMARLMGVPRILGYGIRGGGFLLSQEVPYDESVHEVDRALNLVRALGVPTADAGGLEVFLDDEDRSSAARMFDEVGKRDGRLVVAMCPASRNPSRMWRGERFAAVARHLVAEHGAHVLLFGQKGDDDEALRDLPGVTSFIGRTSLRGFAAALERVDLIVSVESSPIHFASALAKPIVTLFGGSSLPEHWGPYRTRHRIVHREVPCSPCHQLRCPLPTVLCMEEIGAQDVVAACDDLIRELRSETGGFSEPSASRSSVRKK